MEFILACVIFGIAFVILSGVNADIFLDKKHKRQQKELEARNWK